MVFHPDPEQHVLALTGKTKTTHLFTWANEADNSNRIIKAKNPDRGWLNQAWSAVSREIPNYITSQGSLIQIASQKNCLAIFHPEQPELILISPDTKLSKYLYRLDPPETRQILMLQLI